MGGGLALFYNKCWVTICSNMYTICYNFDGDGVSDDDGEATEDEAS